MSLASCYLLVGIIPSHTPYLRALDRLAVHTPGACLLVTPQLASEGCSYLVVDTLPSTVVSPSAEVMVDTLPVGILAGQHSPLTPSHYYIQDGVDDLSHVESARSATRLCLRYVISDTLPLTVSQVRRISLVLHTPSLSPFLPGRHTFSDSF